MEISLDLKNKLTSILSENYADETKQIILSPSTFGKEINNNIIELFNNKLFSTNAKISFQETYKDLIIYIVSYNSNNFSIFILDQNLNFITFFTEYYDGDAQVKFTNIINFMIDVNGYLNFILSPYATPKFVTLNDILFDLSVKELFFIKNISLSINLPEAPQIINFYQDTLIPSYFNFIFYYKSNSPTLNSFSLWWQQIKTEDVDTPLSFNQKLETSNSLTLINLKSMEFISQSSDKVVIKYAISTSAGIQVSETVDVTTSWKVFADPQTKNEYYSLSSNPNVSRLNIIWQDPEIPASTLPQDISYNVKYRIIENQLSNLRISITETNILVKGFPPFQKTRFNSAVWSAPQPPFPLPATFSYKLSYRQVIVNQSEEGFSFYYAQNDPSTYIFRLIGSKIETGISENGNIIQNNNEIYASFRRTIDNISNIYWLKFEIPSNPQALPLVDSFYSTAPIFLKVLKSFDNITKENSLYAFQLPTNNSIIFTLFYRREPNEPLKYGTMNILNDTKFIFTNSFGIRQNNYVKFFIADSTNTNYLTLDNSYSNQAPSTDPYIFEPYNNNNQNFNPARILSADNNQLTFDNNILNVTQSNNNLVVGSTIDQFSLNDQANNNWFLFSNTNNKMLTFPFSITKNRTQIININFDLTFSVIDNSMDKNSQQIPASITLASIFSTQNDLELINNNAIYSWQLIYEDGSSSKVELIKPFLRIENNFIFFEITIFNNNNKKINNILLYNKINNILVNKELNLKSSELLNLQLKFEIKGV